MMLRSASTPSLVSSLTAKSPARHQASPPPTAACGQVSCKCKCSSGGSHAGFPRSRVNSPKGPDATEIRRAQSAGNLEETFNAEEFSLSRQSSRRLSRMPTLEAIPSYDNDDDEEEEEEEDLNLFTVQNLAGLEAGTREFNGFCDVGEGKMYLASGIGLNAIGFLEDGGFGGRGGGGGGSSRPGDGFRDGGGDNRGLSLEYHYKSMLMQDPCNPLYRRRGICPELRNIIPGRYWRTLRMATLCASMLESFGSCTTTSKELSPILREQFRHHLIR